MKAIEKRIKKRSFNDRFQKRLTTLLLAAKGNTRQHNLKRKPFDPQGDLCLLSGSSIAFTVSDPSCKDGDARFTVVPLKPC